MVGQTSVQEEIDGVVGGQRMVSISDMSRLPLTEAVIMEVQRVRNILPLGVPHGTLQVRLFRVRSESTANEKKNPKNLELIRNARWAATASKPTRWWCRCCAPSTTTPSSGAIRRPSVRSASSTRPPNRPACASPTSSCPSRQVKIRLDLNDHNIDPRWWHCRVPVRPVQVEELTISSKECRS